MSENHVVLALFILCIVGLKPSFILGDTDASDSLALNNMFTSMNSPGQLSQWTATGGDPCGQKNWKGITCSGSRVTQIKLSGLGLSGSLGYQLDKLTSVTEFDLSNNNLGGDLPYQLPPNLERLNLANNQFTGSAQYSISLMTPLKYLNLAHNQLKQLAIDFTKLTSLSILDLSSNTIAGSLPNTMSSLTSAKSIYLQNNQFTGTIDVLATLPLENLNIANNRFTGWIPDSLRGINLQKDGNSFNTGPAPPPPPGTPPIRRSPTPKSGNRGSSPSSGGDSSSSSDSKSSGLGAGGIAGIVISLLVVTAVIAFFLVKRKRSKRTSSTDIERSDQNVNEPFTVASNDIHQENKSMQTPPVVETKKLDTSLSMNLRPPPSERHKSFDEEDSTPRKPIVAKKHAVLVPSNVNVYTVADLQIATNSFSVDNLLGEGTFGRVYRAQFDDGKVLAVKKIDSSALPTDTAEDFTEIVSKIAHLDHENVTKLDGYCSEHGQHLVIYEFHRNGSLHDVLHLSEDESKPLIWNPRVKIALGTARALEYLHEVCSPSIVHKNIKSANILLDSELNPHLSDSGLASFLPTANELLNQNDEGYSAPEVSMSGQYSLQSDVYSFGVVMLELLTGRKPFDSTRSRSEQSLVRWATPQLHDIDALSKMVDPALKGLYPVKSLSRFADVIALCVQPEPEFRPPMSEVVQALVVLVQRANMSKRTVGVGSGSSGANDYM
ncbi:Protein STRUBBELIG-RECEPTOR FAMILY 7 [Raphanus sativus]|uniref:Protein STRUBBELIG-RECEPTOR FAMILY 7 n=1 Tax=Raphanus sativus TaxID=3726 RepID=A0A6J0P5W9_RAPSA|nr:protein STRUBBELIG-RECEPTOR FAMILY 7 [Raphanus sativus]KAJ4893599.1 Protein STRUBBELIG-RECEPTOR FAMILY 7 [Raphanus sativus]